MSNKNDTRKPEPKKLPAKDKDTELQVEELEERVAPMKYFN